MRNLPVPQKIMACLFVAALCAAAFLVWGRAADKRDYQAREEKQCDLLAASLLMLFIEKTESEPDMWSFLKSDKIIMTLDHRAMPGEWNVRLTVGVSPDGGTVELRADAASGWNSRAPGSAARGALLSGIGSGNPRVSYRESAGFIPEPESERTVKTLPFVYPDGQAPPLKIEALVVSFKDRDDGKTYIVLKLKK